MPRVFSLLRVKDYAEGEGEGEGEALFLCTKEQHQCATCRGRRQTSAAPRKPLSVLPDVAKGHTRVTGAQSVICWEALGIRGPDRQAAPGPDVPMLSVFAQVSRFPPHRRRLKEIIINTSFHDSVCLLRAILIHIISVL